MAIYAWKGLKDGQYASGRMEGINRDEAAFKLKEERVIITSLSKVSGSEVVEKEEKGEQSDKEIAKHRKKSVPVKELVVFTKKLEAMMHQAHR